MNDRQQFLKVIDQDSIEETLVALIDGQQVVVLLQSGALLMNVHHHALHLELLGVD